MKAIISLIGALFLTVSASAQRTVLLYGDLNHGPTSFALADIRKSLEAAHWSVSPRNDLTAENFGPRQETVIVLAKPQDKAVTALYASEGGFATGQLGGQAYALRKTSRSGTTTYWVFGGDEAGVMYGGLRLAEIVALDGLAGFHEETDAPFIARRGIKFNIPLDIRTPSFADGGAGGNGDLHRAIVWDIGFWKDWLDDVARYRYNFISLWNLHPFPNLVKLKDYPAAAMNDVYDSHGLVKKMTIDEKIAMWREVIAHARARCIDITWITWNIFLPYTKTVTDLKESGLDEGTIKYTRECVAELLRTYPDLHGIGLTAGEKMRELTTAEQKEDWVFKTYGQGVLDVAREQPDRQILFIHRYWWTSFEHIMGRFQKLIDQPNIQFDLSFKYARSRLYSDPAPSFAKNKVLGTLPPNLRSWWNLRNDDILTFRWGDPDYVRSSIRNLPPATQTAGFHMGSDRYVWGRETASIAPGKSRPLQTQFNWYLFMLWGRLGYNPSTPDSLFLKSLAGRYPGVDCAALFTAWQAASQAFPMASKFHWHSWDYMWHVESCSGYDPKLTGLNATKRFYDVDSFTDNETMPESGLMTCREYAKAIAAGRQPSVKTPLTHAQLMKTSANQALDNLKLIGPSSNPEIEGLKEDIQAMANAGLYYADKIEAATYHALYQETKEKKYQALAIEHMRRSSQAWELYIGLFRKNYNHGQLSILNRAIDYDELLASVRHDIELVGGTPLTETVAP